jgi:hypothetical protein
MDPGPSVPSTSGQPNVSMNFAQNFSINFEVLYVSGLEKTQGYLIPTALIVTFPNKTNISAIFTNIFHRYKDTSFKYLIHVNKAMLCKLKFIQLNSCNPASHI